MARQFADWVSESGGVYGLPAGIKTHQQGRCIDLVITSNSLSLYVYECYVDEALDVTSDHSTIITMLGIGNIRGKQDGPSKFKFQKMDDKAFFNALHKQQDALWQELEKAEVTSTQSEQRKRAFDFCIEQLLNAIYQSITVSTLRAKKSGKGKPWWDKEYQYAVAKLKNLRREQCLKELQQIENPWLENRIEKAKITLHKIVKHSKRLYYQKVIGDLDSKTVFKAIRWPNSIRRYTTPPIELADGTLATSNQEKQYALKTALLTPPVTPEMAEPEPIVNLETESRNG